MSAEALALLTAILFAFNKIPLKRGLRFSNVISGVFVALLIDNIVSWILTILFVPLSILKTETILLFVIAGLISPSLAYFFEYMSIEKIGVSSSSPMIRSEPLFAVLGAMILLGETITFSIGAGTMLIVCGVLVLSWKRQRIGRRRDVIYPLLTGMLFGTASVIRKMGLNITNSPILGATIGLTVSLFVFVAYLLLSKDKILLNKNSLWFFSVSSICGFIGRLSLYYALGLGEVVRVEPLVGTSPLFSLLFVHLFLRDVERITAKIIIGSILVVLGGILIVAF